MSRRSTEDLIDGSDDIPAPSNPDTDLLEARRRNRSRRSLIASYLLTLFALVTVNFFLPRAMPSDPIAALVDTSSPSYVHNDQLRAELEEFYGLDRPIIVQYGDYLAGLAHGDLGVSIRYNRPVSDVIAERLPWTLLLVGTAQAVATLVGFLAGVHSGWHRGRPIDRGLLSLVLALRNFPSFFLASIALIVFAVHLDWVPLAGSRTLFVTDMGPLHRVIDVAHHLVLPASVLAVRYMADNYLYMRAGMVGELGADYLLVGRAKGLRTRRLKYGYAARNALLPFVTLAALDVGRAISSGVFVETVFAYPGVGRLLFESLSFRDYPTIQACFLVLTIAVLTANLLADLLYARLDPRTVG